MIRKAGRGIFLTRGEFASGQLLAFFPGTCVLQCFDALHCVAVRYSVL